MNKIKIIYFTPVVIVLIFLIFLFQLLNKDVKKLSSALIEKPVPEFEMQTLYSDITLLNSNDINSSNVALVNVWASWCIPCRAEHEILMLLSKIEGLDLYGINYKDKKINALNFIDNLGNPFKKIGVDKNGRSSMVWGVYGIPETFIIHKGTVIYKHIGPIHLNELENVILPILAKLL
jgi:cytochrome c biogenesis protein CcmG/thiol:disulfide interchange protein DsbE|tara:strand:- start:2720 stop:3253 length:534 start_codon:yes stop_codon:yes gene_type:complete